MALVKLKPASKRIKISAFLGAVCLLHLALERDKAATAEAEAEAEAASSGELLQLQNHLPSAEALPFGQRRQADALVWAGRAEKRPAAQLVQLVAPVPAMYFPRSQSTHALAFGRE